ncbi:hypothetical protein [Streptomyces sp. NRRL F-2580]|uniref:hypothetical protein n=1 Tax=Streptomyces sp. NRRL F-2580 TaxID=1463841 RepID=UPI0018FE57C0|nr:hypothetical protein [Streptomyces sp. NRRL F-2580]
MWEPIAPPARPGGTSGLETAADALVELLAALARRQHEHRSVTASRLTSVTSSGLLPADLQQMAVYYLAKAHRDLGQSAASRQGMQLVADGGPPRPRARRGLVHLARLAGDFPTAYDTAQTLGWAGRQHRVEGDIYWPHGDMNRAAAAYTAARDQAEQHSVAGERATSQAQRALVLAFTDPDTADDELHLAEQLLTGLDLRATSFTLRIAALVRDAGTLRGLEAARALLSRDPRGWHHRGRSRPRTRPRLPPRRPRRSRRGPRRHRQAARPCPDRRLRLLRRYRPLHGRPAFDRVPRQLARRP